MGGKAGKLTLVDDRFYVLPMAPKMVRKFDPVALDFETDAQNSYLAFKKSHPDTIHASEAIADVAMKHAETNVNNEDKVKATREGDEKAEEKATREGDDKAEKKAKR